MEKWLTLKQALTVFDEWRRTLISDRGFSHHDGLAFVERMTEVAADLEVFFVTDSDGTILGVCSAEHDAVMIAIGFQIKLEHAVEVTAWTVDGDESTSRTIDVPRKGLEI